MRVIARAVLGLPRLLQDELVRIRVARHSDVYLTIGIVAGLVLSLCAAQMFGYRLAPSGPVSSTATMARRVLQSPGAAGPPRGVARADQHARGQHAQGNQSAPPDQEQRRSNEEQHVER